MGAIGNRNVPTNLNIDGPEFVFVIVEAILFVGIFANLNLNKEKRLLSKIIVSNCFDYLNSFIFGFISVVALFANSLLANH